MSYPFFPRRIRILKRPKCEIAPTGTQIDVRCMQSRFENSPCCAWSIRQDVDQVLHRQTFPWSSYDALLARGQDPNSAGTLPFTYENCLCSVMWLVGSLTGEKYISKPCWLVCKMKQMTSLRQNRSIYSVLSCD